MSVLIPLRDDRPSYPETGQPAVVSESAGIIRPYHSKLLALVRVLDGLAIYLCLWVATRLDQEVWQTDYSWFGLFAVILYHFFAEYNEVYYYWRGSRISADLLRIFLSWLFALNALVALNLLTTGGPGLAPHLLAVWFGLAFAVVASGHYSRRLALKLVRSHQKNTRNLGIVGCNELGRRLNRVIGDMPWLGYRLVGFYDDRSPRSPRAMREEVPVGNLGKLYQDVLRGRVDVVYITLPLRAEYRTREILRKLADSTASVYYVPDLFGFDLLHSRWDILQGIPVVSVYDSPFRSLDAGLKRLEDLVLSLLILALVALPMLVIAGLIKLTSRGPVIFRQKRYGMLGEEIEVYKFRTMYVHDEGPDIRQAVRGDSRITPLGGFLRRTSLDELPQFINVLQGRMSIVGPRPHAVSHNERYRKLIQGYMLRHKVRPGITGLAQVMGYRGETDTLEKMEMRVRMDMEYIRTWSLWLDVRIIFKTVLYGFRGETAY